MNTEKVVVITGGSRGLGRNAAIKLAENGVGVVLTYHSNQAAAESVVGEIKAMGGKAVALHLDTGKTTTFSDFSEKLSEVLAETWQRTDFDYLLNNAGVGLHVPITQLTEDQFDDLMNIHFKGVVFLTQRLLPFIKDGGSILNVSSGLARFTVPGAAAYAAMKGAIEVFTRYLAKELGPRQITANVIAPGAIETDFGGGRVRDNADMNAFVASVTALGRAGLPDDIGMVVKLLLSDEAHWINGQQIEASGGMVL